MTSTPDSITRQVTSATTQIEQDADLARLLHHAARSAFAAAAVVAEVLVRSLSDSVPAPRGSDHGSPQAMEVADIALGIGWTVAHLLDRGAGRAARALSPAARMVMSPPFVPPQLTPTRLLRGVTVNWRLERPPAMASLDAWSTSMVREVLSRLDIEELLAQSLARVDVSRLVERSLSQVDLTRILEQVLRDMDVSEIAREAAAKIDVSDLVADKVDVVATEAVEEIRVEEAHVEGVAKRVYERVTHRETHSS